MAKGPGGRVRTFSENKNSVLFRVGIRALFKLVLSSRGEGNLLLPKLAVNFCFCGGKLYFWILLATRLTAIGCIGILVGDAIRGSLYQIEWQQS